MNKKGFTLVELLVVIAILGLLLIITMTNGFGIFNKAKSGINKIEEDNLIEAAKVFLVDVDNEFVSNWPNAFCNDRDDYLSGCTVEVDYIINNYMNKATDSCDVTRELNLKIVEDASSGSIDYIVEKVGSDPICVN